MDTLLNLNKEDSGIDWEDDGRGEEEAQIELAVVGKIHTSRNVNANALINNMRRIWNPKHGCEANLIGEKTFYFQFHHLKDKQFVMDSQPWHFDHHLMILDDVKGSFLAMDKSDVIGINKSFRICVLIDVNKSLTNMVELKTGRGPIAVHTKYEKLHVFCYICGLLGHGEKDCDDNVITRKFSEKLWVSTPWKATKNEVVSDEGELSNAVRRLFITKNPKENAAEGNKRVEDGGVMGQVSNIISEPGSSEEEKGELESGITTREEVCRESGDKGGGLTSKEGKVSFEKKGVEIKVQVMKQSTKQAYYAYLMRRELRGG
uniref:CCHC-type domain-containing protein n=1 Tax=Chenopodium quinoa TaxID=63459 RepID=A0A803N1T2_CHEQI